MAIDKAVDSAVLDAALTDVADAIRAKKGDPAGTTYQFPDGFETAIGSISGGSILNSKTVTDNGATYNASDDGYDGYAHVTVDVPIMATKTVNVNATYNASDDNVEGYAQVIVAIPSEEPNIKNILEGTGVIEVPASVTLVMANKFASNAITSLTINATNLRLGQLCFTNCLNLSSITVGKNVGSLSLQYTYVAHKLPFQGDTGINTITFEAKDNSADAMTIGHSVFRALTGLTTVTFGANSVKIIGEASFLGDSSITALSFPDSLQEIGIGAFYNCTSLTEIRIPAAVTTIGKNAFQNCAGIVNAYIYGTPSTLPDASNSVFRDCTNLETIHVPTTWTDSYISSIRTKYTNKSSVVFVKDIN